MPSFSGDHTPDRVPLRACIAFVVAFVALAACGGAGSAADSGAAAAAGDGGSSGAIGTASEGALDAAVRPAVGPSDGGDDGGLAVCAETADAGCFDAGQQGAADAGLVVGADAGQWLGFDGGQVDAPLDGGPGAELDGGGPVTGVDAGPADGGQWSPCTSAEGAGAAPTSALTDGADQATVRTLPASSCFKTYLLASNVALLDQGSGGLASPRTFSESEEQPNVRTRNDLFDALYALALAEAKDDSVAAIKDGAFNSGQPMACPAGGCFETGRKWNYVWTRDTAYSVALGLGAFDPTRARNSLEFKLSPLRDGSSPQIVQDTGSGGSYPVSTDRVAWAMGAWEVLKFLDGPERLAFRERAFEALRNTLEHDRLVVYDSADGLYTGEQSFLDWREQTYPAWVKSDLAHLAMSKALSTNLAHLRALDITAALADERGDTATATRYRGWAEALGQAIRSKFFLAQERLFSTFSSTALDPSVVRRFDALGNAFAVLFGVAGHDAGREVLARYPHAGKGPPTVWPQQQETPIYHNRSFWPFVTAFWLEAARTVRNDAAFDAAVRSLMRGAALNLSNMENFELLSGHAYVSDGANSGPVVNSQRQLWSVAGYLSLVQRGLFGLEATQTGLRFRPYVTRALRRELFSNADTLVLNNFPYRGRRLTVVVRLPAVGGAGGSSGAYAVGPVTVNGQPVGDGEIVAAALPPTARVVVSLVDAPEAAASITWVSSASPVQHLYAPRTPAITETALVSGKVSLSLDVGGESPSAVSFDVYRDGALVQADLPGSTLAWLDPGSGNAAHQTFCYSVETKFLASGNRSHHAAPRCHWCASCVQSIAASDSVAMTHHGGARVNNHGRWHIESWGDPGHTLDITFTARFSGRALLQAVAGNGAGPTGTGVTCGVKSLTVTEVATGAVVARGPLVMPHRGRWDEWGDSSLVRVELQAGKTYRARLEHDPRALNMSAFKHFEAYNGLGGAGGAFHRVNIAELKVLALDGF